MSAQTLKVLGTLMGARYQELSGVDVARDTKLASGTLYPILLRLEDAGWLDSRWEAGDPVSLKRPRRRYYRLTAVGQKRAMAAFDELRPMLRESLAWQ
jgi:DNA-binding PadR family transcriptional regulator